MSDNLKDILSNLNPEVDQELLLQYLQGRLSPEKQHEVEKHLLEDPFEMEALEGLQAMPDQQKIALLVDGLNRDLRKKTAKKNARRRRLELHVQPWQLITIVAVLLLVVLSYFILHRLLHH